MRVLCCLKRPAAFFANFYLARTTHPESKSFEGLKPESELGDRSDFRQQAASYFSVPLETRLRRKRRSASKNALKIKQVCPVGAGRWKKTGKALQWALIPLPL